MVSHPALREIVGADFLGAVSGSDLASAHFRFRIMSLLLFYVVKLCLQQGKCLGFILNLRLFRLAVYDNARRIMGQAHCRIGSIHTLSAVSRRPHHIHPDILLIDGDVNILIHLRHHSHADGRGMNAASALRLRHSLHSVYAALILHSGIGALAINHKLYFLHAADPDLVRVHGFYLPPPSFRIVYIHAVYLRRKKSRLISAGAGPDFHNHILFIVGILRQQQNLHLLLQLLRPFPIFGQSFFDHLPHFVVVFFLQHSQGILDLLPAPFVFPVGLHNRRQIALLLHQLSEPLLIIGHGRFMELSHDLFEPDQ